MRVQWKPSHPMPHCQGGEEVDLCMFIDSHHASNKYMNMSLINWYSKKQSTLETSVFGAEFVAMKVGVETLHAIWLKLRMMGIPILGASFIHNDNTFAIYNTSKPESTLKKKCNAIVYLASMSLWQWERHWQAIYDQNTIKLTHYPR